MRPKKCLLLLPTRYNDGTDVMPETLRGILVEIDKAFDGHTVDGHVDGTYRMADGTMAQDRSLKVWVLVKSNQIDALKTLARRIAGQLKQETLYFEVTASEVEFLPPLPENGGDV